MSRWLYWFIPPRHRWPVVRQRLLGFLRGFLLGGLCVALYGYGVLGVDTVTLETAKVVRLIDDIYVEPMTTDRR